jgi:putative hemolysin
LVALWEWFLLIILLFMSAFFSATETSFMSLSRLRIHHLVKKKVNNASLVMKMIADPGHLLSTILVGNNLVNVAASALATSIALRLFGQAGIGIAVSILTLLILVFAEITPKTYAAANSVSLSLKIARLVSWIEIIFNPVVKLLGIITDLLMKLIGSKAKLNRITISEEEIRTLIDLGKSMGSIEPDEVEMITKIFDLNDTLVRDVMIHRVDIVGISIDATLEQAWEVFADTTHSRIPVFKDTLDNIIGMLYARDLLKYHKNIENESIENIMRKPYYVPVTKPINDLLTEFRREKTHIAVVLDEFGGTAGLVFLEDVLETVIGTIGDEYDETAPLVKKIGKKEFLVSARAKVADINQLMGLELPHESFDTLGRLVLRLLGDIPAKGDIIDLPGAVITIDKVDKNRAKIFHVNIKSEKGKPS